MSNLTLMKPIQIFLGSGDPDDLDRYRNNIEEQT
jgi:hypothetical protein